MTAIAVGRTTLNWEWDSTGLPGLRIGERSRIHQASDRDRRSRRAWTSEIDRGNQARKFGQQGRVEARGFAPSRRYAIDQMRLATWRWIPSLPRKTPSITVVLLLPECVSMSCLYLRGRSEIPSDPQLAVGAFQMSAAPQFLLQSGVEVVPDRPS